jgi:hypothetical protein
VVAARAARRPPDGRRAVHRGVSTRLSSGAARSVRHRPHG